MEMRAVIWGLLIPFIGTAGGAACVFFLKKDLRAGIQRALTGFAAGVMVAASIWSLIVPAIEQSAEKGRWAFLPAFIGFWLGILFLLLLDHIIPHLHRGIDRADQTEGPKSSLNRTIMMVLAVTLHNIPEGMAVAVPLISGGMSKWRSVGVTALSGSPTILGALMGFLIGAISPTALVISLSFASGAMLYVVFGELLPESILMWKSKLPAALAVLGLLTGLIIIYL